MTSLVFRVTRDTSKNGTTIGRLWISEDAGTTWVNALWTLEDQIREIVGQPVESWKVWGETAIPNGTYRVTVRWSEHFQRDMPHIEDVPGFLEIMLHGLNTAAQTHGCVGNAHNHPTEDTIQGDATADTIMPALARHGNIGTIIIEGPVAG